MSVGNLEKFPWGRNEPSVRLRLIVALMVAVLAVVMLYPGLLNNPKASTDFEMIWTAAKAMLAGRDPYRLFGPSLEFRTDYPLLWPGTALVAVLPLTLLPVWPATLLFVAVSSFLLTWGITRDSWHRLPILISAAFFDSVMGAQWSILLTAALFLPWLSIFAAVKPQSGVPVMAAARDARTLRFGMFGGLALLAVSLILIPGWPWEWLGLVSSVHHMKSLLLVPGGFLILLVLFRWRRPESWLLLAAAAMPQTLMWYSALMPLSIARTYRESAALSLLSSFGYLASGAVTNSHLQHKGSIIWALLVASSYLPAVALVLRRPSRGELPIFLRRVPHLASLQVAQPVSGV